MQWDADVIEQELRNCDYFRDHCFCFAGRNVRKPGTQFEAYEFRLENPATQRAVEFTFAPPRGNLPAVFQVYLQNMTKDDDFNLEEYLRQHHSVNLDDGFKCTDYSGSFQERVQGFLDFATNLLKDYAEKILQGIDWPDVNFDWGGTR